MVDFPNCKINLGLRVRSKRADGYHDLDTVFYPVPLRDAAEIVVTSNTADQQFQLHLSGNTVDGSVEENLCYKAWNLLARDFPGMPPLKMYLHKVIPSGAGLGGGSSNGAFTLKILDELLRLRIPQVKMIEYALQLGSDCPFFIINKPCHATGRGEKLRPIALNLEQYYFLLVHPGIHVNTGWAFTELTELRNRKIVVDERSTSEIVSSPIDTWRENLVNDFEQPVFAKHPELLRVKEQLYGAGAIYASLTGSGSCLYGIFKRSESITVTGLNPAYKVYHLKTNT